MRELMQELASNTESVFEQILANYIIKLVPMINVDGVAIGNARASLVGVDLNRRWTAPNPVLHPEVYFLKRQIERVNGAYEKGIQIFCDLHGHNKKYNSFFYGCHKAANSGLLSWTKTRLLPRIMAKMTPSLFAYKDCRFKIDNTKLNTARVVCWNEFKITNSFTLEASMFNGRRNAGSEFGIKELQQIGRSLLMAVTQYNSLEPELEQELLQTNGWLKMTKLNDVVTGKQSKKQPEVGREERRPE